MDGPRWVDSNHRSPLHSASKTRVNALMQGEDSLLLHTLTDDWSGRVDLNHRSPGSKPGGDDQAPLHPDQESVVSGQ